MCCRYYRRSDKQRIAEAYRLGDIPFELVLPDWDFKRRSDYLPAGHPREPAQWGPRAAADALGPRPHLHRAALRRERHFPDQRRDIEPSQHHATTMA
jgi:hypothetical protein